MKKSSQKIAIIGMSGIFPDAPTLTHFYRNLRQGVDSVRAISPERLYYGGESPHLEYRRMGHLGRIDTFDHKFFNISKSEADNMSPHQRILLELSLQGIENAGYDIATLARAKGGVYVGGSPNYTYAEKLEADDLTIVSGNLAAMEAGRLAYVLNIKGPAIVIDTACSSALVALHYAFQDLLSGRVDFALVGACKIHFPLPLDSAQTEGLTVASREGKSRAFDADADGTGMGEGGGVLVLKKLSKALADKDNVRAVILGTAVNHGGSRSNGITAPSPDAQSEVLRQCWHEAGVPPGTITYLEAHGTGTKLGDPIEFQGLTDAFNAYGPTNTKFCAVGSVKTNIGHLDNAAAIAGLIKCVLSLQHRELFPSLHFHHPNPYIDFEKSAAYINTACKPWEVSQSPRRCGISSFGISGTNAHALLEEAPVHRAKVHKKEKELFLKVSAKSPSVLVNYLENIHQAIADDSPGRLEDLLYTLNTGRGDYPYRSCVIAKDREALLHHLQAAVTAVRRNPALLSVKSKRSLVLLFSNDGISSQEAEALAASYPVFRKALQSIKAAAGKRSLSRQEARFASQYALFKILESQGLAFASFIGQGIGKITRQVIAGTITLKQALDWLQDPALDQASANESKLRSFTEKSLSSGNPIFLEVGSSGDLYNHLVKWKPELPGLNVLPLIEPGTTPSILKAIGLLYEQGVDIDWKKFHENKKAYRIEAPTYPFEKIRCWYSDPPRSLDKKVTDWFFDTRWVRQPGTDSKPQEIKLARVLVVLDDLGVGQRLSERLRAGQVEVLEVRFGEVYQELGNAFVVRATEEADFERVRKRLDEQGLLPDTLVHLGNLKRQQPLTRYGIDESLAEGVYSQLLLVKAFDQDISRNEMRLVLVSADAFRVAGEENQRIFPEKATSFGFGKGLRAEYENLQIKCIDLAEGKQQPLAEWAAIIWNELRFSNAQIGVAYRDKERFVQELVRLDLPYPGNRERIRPGGTYLITGGSSGIGYEVSKYLAAFPGVKLIILGKTALPDNPEGMGRVEDGKVLAKVANLQQLREKGAQVHYYCCDASNADELEAIYHLIKAKHGLLNGIVHSAALPGRKRVKQNNLNEFKEVLKSRIVGIVAFEELTRQDNLDFLTVFSSVSSIYPAFPRKTDYAAGCVWAEAYIKEVSRHRADLQVIHWCDWQETGMTFRVQPDPDAFSRQNKFMYLTSRDGLLAFEYLMSANAHNVLVIGNTQLATPAEASLITNNSYFTAAGENTWFPKPSSESICSETKDKNLINEPVTSALKGKEITTTESVLAGFWTEVLKLDQLELTDDFFEKGGHSINGFQILNRIESHWGLLLEMDDLFTYPVFRDLARHIDHLLAGKELKLPATGIQPIEEQDFHALSNAQKHLWIMDFFDNEKAMYNLPRALRLSGNVRPDQVAKAIETLVKQHESLRTTLVLVDGEPRQKIHPADTVKISLEPQDCRQALSLEGTAREIISREATRPFDLTEESARFKLFQVADDEYILLIVLHHIFSDGLSMGIFIKQWMDSYQSYQAGESLQPDRLSMQFKDIIAWENRQAGGEKARKNQRYWIEKLVDATPQLNLPVDFPRPHIRSGNSKVVRITLDEEITKQLNEICHQQGISQFMGLLGILYVVLYQYSGQPDIIVSTAVAGRLHQNLEDQIGLYANKVLFRNILNPEDTFGRILQKVKGMVLEAFEHQEYPFGQLVEELGFRKEMNRSALSDVVVTFQSMGTKKQPDSVAEATLTPFDIDFLPNFGDLGWTFLDYGHYMEIELVYSTDLFHHHTMEEMLGHYQDLTRRAFLDTGLAVSGMPLGPAGCFQYPPTIRGLNPVASQEDWLYGGDASVQLLELSPQAEKTRVLEKNLSYWQEQLAGVVPLNLPRDYAHPAMQSRKGASTRFRVDKELTQQLNTLSQQQGVSLFMTLLSAFKVLLYRYCGQEDICVGVPMAGWQQREVEGGLFINTLALRSQLNDQLSFNSVLGRVKETLLGAYEHHEVPFEKVVEAMDRERDWSRHPLFQVMFVWQNNSATDSTAIISSGATLLLEVAEQTSSRVDLIFILAESGDGLAVGVEYCTDWYNQETIVRMGGHYTQLLRAIIKEPASMITQLKMVTPVEEHQLLVEFNNTAVAYPQDKTVVDLFEEQVEKAPDNVAVVLEEQYLTYRALNERANQLAHYLRSKEVKEESLVPICIERSIEVIVGILGILKAGGTYVPIDAAYPQDRIAYMLEDTRASLIVTSSSARERVAFSQERVIVDLDADWGSIGKESSANLPTTLASHYLTYVIYTSGSTGVPKGAGVFHRSIVNLLQWYIREFAITNQDCNMIISSLGFDLTQKNIFGTLLAGGVIAMPFMQYYDSQLITKCINDKSVTIVNCAPSAFYPLVEESIVSGDLNSLRLVVLGGEPIQLKRLTKWTSGSNCSYEIVNSYGPTECTDIAAFYRLDNPSRYANGSIPIGRPNDNVQLLILNESEQLQPIGVVGELLIAGDSLGSGYLNQPELTASKFVSNPFSKETGSMLYRTGDLARWLPNGNVEYLGRLDDQVKIRGYRIELGEIESVLQRSKLVRQAVVLARADDAGSKRLIGYIVPAGKFDKQGITAYLNSQLPEYMVPAILVEMESFPISSNGKIDRKALPKVHASELLSDQYVAPHNQIEQQLAIIWQEVLGVERVGIYDNFFELGGDSFKVIKAYLSINTLYPNAVKVPDLFDNPTIAAQTICIQKKLQTKLPEKDQVQVWEF